MSLPAVIVLAAFPLFGSPIVLKGADGQSLTLHAPAERVVSLSPDFAELMFDIDAGQALVGTSEYSDFPEAAKEVPRIGDGFHFDVEKIVALKPDLVLVWQGGTPQAVTDRLRQLKLPVLAIGTHELTDVAANLETLGHATGHEAGAEKAAQAYRTGLSALEAQYLHAAPIRVFFEITEQPLYTVGGNQSISRLMALCGGRNVFADLSELGPAVSVEAVLARDPEVIVTGDDVEGDAVRLQVWQQWPALSAVRYKNLYAVNGDWISRATPRLLDAAKQVCADLDQARAHLAAH